MATVCLCTAELCQNNVRKTVSLVDYFLLLFIGSTSVEKLTPEVD